MLKKTSAAGCELWDGWRCSRRWGGRDLCQRTPGDEGVPQQPEGYRRNDQERLAPYRSIFRKFLNFWFFHYLFCRKCRQILILISGDIGHYDKERDVFVITDRLKELIKYKGNQVRDDAFFKVFQKCLLLYKYMYIKGWLRCIHLQICTFFDLLKGSTSRTRGPFVTTSGCSRCRCDRASGWRWRWSPIGLYCKETKPRSISPRYCVFCWRFVLV